MKNSKDGHWTVALHIDTREYVQHGSRIVFGICIGSGMLPYSACCTDSFKWNHSIRVFTAKKQPEWRSNNESPTGCTHRIWFVSLRNPPRGYDGGGWSKF